ncbi:hypothetical protein B0H17DRAFT_1124841 [Mycena rosella]|uniref:Uncharacterized protein n=1 Tax=Mycena rosella TaxID=1033263 RepID=A0AAD7MAI5_MYCRO|nr:hypothetical protein B0H17DRAFT_1124841 [Mycena rosella]
MSTTMTATSKSTARAPPFSTAASTSTLNTNINTSTDTLSGYKYGDDAGALRRGRPRMLTKSYSLPLWRKQAAGPRAQREEEQEHVVLKVALPRTSHASRYHNVQRSSILRHPACARSKSRSGLGKYLRDGDLGRLAEFGQRRAELPPAAAAADEAALLCAATSALMPTATRSRSMCWTWILQCPRAVAHRGRVREALERAKDAAGDLGRAFAANPRNYAVTQARRRARAARAQARPLLRRGPAPAPPRRLAPPTERSKERCKIF